MTGSSASALTPLQLQLGTVRLDPLREIAANKICTLLGRVETKDLLDVRSLLAQGLDLRQALADAEKKDAGVNAAMLAFLLEDEATWNVPADSAEDLAAFRRELARQLRAIAFEQARRR